ncbi:16S rRNA (uracil(1498)-N(3))-methyltransferase [Fructilactobacillus sanfranciscensis]|uniref:16S rRNA (uracil(1498)-N(3))-methyltransferase n=1 Tax=Fructilactobacillus sanfranciscensis TaxID=1625 RepID=UPI0006F13FD2|nr:16S rRNA (uracil(1498)-N(3))-methyltransferase [Fructilactobacillus sanfranciscensis]KRM80767.1 ribosomal RNA small subunit methyltransferase E [Fructilactobacillus sanfranciscensis DSM 20451]MCG7194353.1 16S rRNA (uracil(1498)-N(3))-methyltransferase [Fructilactobacillus sanfranciscensis]MDN4461800.1 16S rRNA (uracil(1498)-N(3))-methyltransferase [Fructilactobacillus sanfranciscensis]MVF15057.1 16S rRNA (uracil(1498)-N(3))-methyltransferase [Fructilactobacillus sanfranciscensis]NDR61183.1 
MQHYFLNQSLEVGDQLELPTEIKKHWLRVMRAEKGSKAEFVANNQLIYIGELIDEQNGKIELIKKIEHNVELPFAVTIACGLPKNGKAELIVQKATEMGVNTIIFLPTDWSVAKWNQKAVKKVDRLQKIAKSAAEQSHRNLIPKVMYLDGLNKLCEIPANQKVVAYEESAKHGESSNLVKVVNSLDKGEKLLAFFGPEGGISPDEISKLKDMNFTLVGLGPRILRTESAPLYFLSAVSALSELK